MREIPLFKAAFGDYGPSIQQRRLGGKKEPIVRAIQEVLLELAPVREGCIVESRPPIIEDPENEFVRKALAFLPVNADRISATKAPVPDNPLVLTRHIKCLGYILRADIVGVCKIPEYAWYSQDLQGNPIQKNYEYAILFVFGKHLPTVEASTGFDWIVETLSYEVYLHSAFVSRVVAEYIKNLGYAASAQHTLKMGGAQGGFEGMLPPLLLWAGIGEVCRAGIILNPYLGADYKASAVLTNLPLIPDGPIDFGLQDFCYHCKRCADACPSNAISHSDKVMYNGYETWKINEKRCTSFNIMNTKGSFCLMCTKVCPWTRPTTWEHNLARHAFKRSSIARRVSIWAEKYLHHGEPHYQEKWWFDLAKSNGGYQVPPKASE
jgi:reductive dehalogenase